jgi:hypothetical protein
MKIIRKNKLFIFITDDLLKKGLLRPLPDKYFIALEYFVMTRKILNLNKPVTFNEKIQWIKVYGGLEKYTGYVDKLRVKKYINQIIGDQYFVPTIGVWDRFEDIPFDQLPQQFVLKATHGSGYVFVCRDKSTLDINSLKKTVNKWLHENFYIKTRERQYMGCKPKIICEKYLGDRSVDPTDYKIFCYNGEPRIIEVVWDRFTSHKGDVYKDLNWKTLNIGYIGFPYSRKNLIKPDNLNAMLDISRKLSKIFPFVRVDLYSVNNKIYFGELTFTPANGVERFDPPEADYFLGKEIDLSKYNKNQPAI